MTAKILDFRSVKDRRDQAERARLDDLICRRWTDGHTETEQQTEEDDEIEGAPA